MSINESGFTHQQLKDSAIKERSLKDRFLIALMNGELGTLDNRGLVVTLKEFKAYFSDIKTDYINTFLPAATLEPGQHSVSQTKYLFRLKKGVYLVHPDVLQIVDA